MRIALRQAAALDRDDVGHWRTREHVTSLTCILLTFRFSLSTYARCEARGQSAVRETFGRLTAWAAPYRKETHQPIRCSKSPSPEWRADALSLADLMSYLQGNSGKPAVIPGRHSLANQAEQADPIAEVI